MNTPSGSSSLRMGERRRLKKRMQYERPKCPGCLVKTERVLLRDDTTRCTYCGHVEPLRSDREAS